MIHLFGHVDLNRQAIRFIDHKPFESTHFVLNLVVLDQIPNRPGVAATTTGASLDEGLPVGGHDQHHHRLPQ
jgi:hypothetical protein